MMMRVPSANGVVLLGVMCAWLWLALGCQSSPPVNPVEKSRPELFKPPQPLAMPRPAPPTPRVDPPPPADPTRRDAFKQTYPPDTMLVAGQPIPVGTRVVLFTERGGYNAYCTPAYYGPRVDRFNNGQPDLPRDQAIRIAKQGYTLPELQNVVDQFVLHYDATGLASKTFSVLRERGLSAHFLLDLDGTIYQTLDLQERAWHARESNSRSIGIEIANVGAFPPGEAQTFQRWYATDPFGQVTLRLPPNANLLKPARPLAPARSAPVVGNIHHKVLTQYDLTDAQYDALIKLTAALCRTFPKLKPQAPTDAQGNIIPHVLTPPQLTAFRGILGHYHVTDHKIDPGPAFDWQRLLRGVQQTPSP